ncbi:MAG: isoprenylcysteine carboxylmethyltransferase family protein [Vicinamibacterales bacterium]
MTPAARASLAEERPAGRGDAKTAASGLSARLEAVARVRLLGCDLSDFAARVVVGGLFGMLTVRLVADFLQTGRLTGLLLVTSEALVVILTVVRRPAAAVDRTWLARSVTAASILGPPLLRPAAVGIVPDHVTATVSACALTFIVAAKVSLGRSFGVVPANRGVVHSGLYRLVRHPIYLGYIVTHVAFVLANLTAWNVTVVALSDAALVVRSLLEERTLEGDERYIAYRAEVRWRLVPGVF